MITVWNRFVPAAGPMNMGRAMPFVAVLGRTVVRIPLAHFDHVLNARTARVMQMAIVEVVDMIAVLDRDVAAPGPVMVQVFRRHETFLSS